MHDCMAHWPSGPFVYSPVSFCLGYCASLTCLSFRNPSVFFFLVYSQLTYFICMTKLGLKAVNSPGTHARDLTITNSHELARGKNYNNRMIRCEYLDNGIWSMIIVSFKEYSSSQFNSSMTLIPLVTMVSCNYLN